jgi:hypothetical protein
LGVVESFPPVAADDGVVGLGGLPDIGAGIFLEGRSCFDLRARVFGREAAAGPKQGEAENEKNFFQMRLHKFHRVPP